MKHVREFPLTENRRKWRAACQWCRTAGYGFLVTDGSKTYQDILQHQVTESFRKEMLRRLRQRPFTRWGDYREFEQAFSGHWLDSVALALKEGFVWHKEPFYLGLAQIAIGATSA